MYTVWLLSASSCSLVSPFRGRLFSTKPETNERRRKKKKRELAQKMLLTVCRGLCVWTTPGQREDGLKSLPTFIRLMWNREWSSGRLGEKRPDRSISIDTARRLWKGSSSRWVSHTPGSSLSLRGTVRADVARPWSWSLIGFSRELLVDRLLLILRVRWTSGLLFDAVAARAVALLVWGALWEGELVRLRRLLLHPQERLCRETTAARVSLSPLRHIQKNGLLAWLVPRQPVAVATSGCGPVENGTPERMGTLFLSLPQIFLSRYNKYGWQEPRVVAMASGQLQNAEEETVNPLLPPAPECWNGLPVSMPQSLRGRDFGLQCGVTWVVVLATEGSGPTGPLGTVKGWTVLFIPREAAPPPCLTEGPPTNWNPPL